MSGDILSWWKIRSFPGLTNWKKKDYLQGCTHKLLLWSKPHALLSKLFLLRIFATLKLQNSCHSSKYFTKTGLVDSDFWFLDDFSNLWPIVTLWEVPRWKFPYGTCYVHMVCILLYHIAELSICTYYVVGTIISWLSYFATPWFGCRPPMRIFQPSA